MKQVAMEGVGQQVRRRLPQVLRKTLQLGVVLFIVYAALNGPWRNYKLAHNHRRLVGLIHGETWGALYGLNEDLLSRWGDSYQASFGFLGMPWAGRIFGWDTVDPILAGAQLLQGGALSSGLLLGVLLPLLLALLLGKVFCSHLCPMRLCFELAQLVRAGLFRLGVPLWTLSSDTRLGGWVLLGGMLATAIAGTGVWLLLLPYVSLSASLYLLVAAGLVSGLAAVALAWFAVDVLLAPGYFCRNLCPTGFLLEQIGRFSLLRLRKLDRERCPQSCNLCQRRCPYQLLPKTESHRPACDNCGQCVVVCPARRLGRRLALPMALLLLAVPNVANAHHNKGLPHYGYFENYPQVPTEEYVEIHGKWEIGATIFNFQGLDRRNADTPNDVKIYAYLYDLDRDRAYLGPVDFEIHHDNQIVARFHRAKVDEESVYSTRETLPHSGEYTLVARVGQDAPSFAFHVDLAADRVNWWVVGAVTVPVALVFALALIGRSRRGRRRRTRPRVMGPQANALGSALVLFGLAGLSIGVARAEPRHHAGHGAAAVDWMKPNMTKSARVCAHCGMVNCTMDHGGAADHGGGRATKMAHYKTAQGDTVMVMGGIPLWLFLIGVGGILVLSFVATEKIAPRVGRGLRLNLVKNKRAYRLLRSRWAQALPQLAMVALLAFLIYAGLFGSRVANITPIAVWTLWWAGLIFAVLLLAASWCFVCPWDGIANLFSRLRLASRVEGLSLRLPFPRALANMYPAIGLFVVLTWLELGFGVTTDPRFTAYMGLGMAALATICALLWDGKRFCAHICPVGRICGIYGTFSPVEIRARNPKTCQVCHTEDCLHGNKDGYPCPTGISLKTVEDATMCTMCTECFKSCDKHNVALNIRPFGADLRSTRAIRLDEAWLALMLLVLTLFHGLSMTPAWENFRPGGTSLLKWIGLTFNTSRTLNFSIAMLAVMTVPIGLYWASCWLGARLSGGEHAGGKLFRQFAYSLLPIALFYHLAHNLMHLLMEGGHIVPLLSDPLGNGANLFGTRDMHVGSLISDQWLWLIQVGLILTGHIFGIVVAHRVGHSLYREKRAATLSLVPMLAMMILISVAGLGLMHLDMNMRVGRM